MVDRRAATGGLPSGPVSPLLDDLTARLPSARLAIEPHLVRTPLVELPGAATGTGPGPGLLLKCEHLQHTGSFKVRGALAKLAALGPEGRDRGVIAASSGNHGLGMAHALAVLGGRGVVCVPENASVVKVAAIRRLGVEVRHLGRESGRTEVLTRAWADEHGWTYVSPYNDLDVVAGQGSLGLELAEQAGPQGLDAVVVAVGGGGLIAGVAAALRLALPDVRIIGASPVNDAVMAASVRAGRIVEVDAQPTLSDGTAGGLERGAVTLDLCQILVDEWALVTEAEIADALRLVIDLRHELIEGAAAVAVAAALRRARVAPGERVAVVSCGANISAATLAAALVPEGNRPGSCGVR